MALVANNKGLGSGGKKTVEILAQEVLAGKWGNGSDRVTRLTKAGYDAKAVQNRVNQIVASRNSAKTEPAKPTVTNKAPTTTNPSVNTSKPMTSTPTVSTPTVSTPTVTTPTVQTGPTDYQKQLMEYFKQENETARKSAIDAIDKRVNASKTLYNSQLNSLGDQYQALRNQSEVERYKTRKQLREALANRGQLDSGYGRQENLIMDTQYGNAINSINAQEQSARNDINNMILQLQAEGEADKASVNNQYTSAIQQMIAQMMMNTAQ